MAIRAPRSPDVEAMETSVAQKRMATKSNGNGASWKSSVNVPAGQPPAYGLRRRIAAGGKVGAGAMRKFGPAPGPTAPPVSTPPGPPPPAQRGQPPPSRGMGNRRMRAM